MIKISATLTKNSWLHTHIYRVCFLFDHKQDFECNSMTGKSGITVATSVVTLLFLRYLSWGRYVVISCVESISLLISICDCVGEIQQTWNTNETITCSKTYFIYQYSLEKKRSKEESIMYSHSQVLGLRSVVSVPPQHCWVLPKHIAWQGFPVCGERNMFRVRFRWMKRVETGALPSLRLEGWVRLSWLTGVPDPGLGLVMPGYRQMAPLTVSNRAPEHTLWLKEEDLPFKDGKPPLT